MQSAIIEKIRDILKTKDRAIIAIDGKCASGKTTLSEKLEKELHCSVIHMDDFFLRPEQRSEDRLNSPGENVDHERFLLEVLKPLIKGERVFIKPFVCKTQTFGKAYELPQNRITIIEGSYSCHENLRQYYDLHIFCDVDNKTQLERIQKRNGKEALEIFKTKWIPLEEKYFKAFNIKENSEIVIK